MNSRIAATKLALFAGLVTGIALLFGCGGGSNSGGGGSTPTVTVTLTASSQTVLTGGAVNLSAAVSGTSNTAVTWTVNGTTNGNSLVGTISGSGLTAVYTAPASVPNPATVTITATSAADSTASGSVAVTINSSGVSINVGPTAATVPLGTSEQFNATVTGTTNPIVTWQVSGGSTNGTITSDGIYTAPNSVPATAVTITATSAADTSQKAFATVTVTKTVFASNQQIIRVNSGPLGGAGFFVNLPYINVTICVPNTGPCQTIYNVEVDTMSEGLQLLSSAVSLNLPPVTDNSADSLQECVQYGDGSYAWGPIVSADVKMGNITSGGETATNVPIQIIPATPQFPVPTDCQNNGGPNLNNLQTFGANGILGVGVFQQDCGAGCNDSANAVPGNMFPYFLCSTSSGCSFATVPVQFQRQNPVWMFASDNNGLNITLPPIPELGQESVTGTMTFGIATQSNNVLGTALVLTTDSSGYIRTAFKGTTYGGSSGQFSYIDSGSNAYYLLDATTVGVPTCADNSSFYCPSSTQTFSATNIGLNAAQSLVSFRIANADDLLKANNANNWAFDDYAGSFPSSFDWGLPFFFGKTVFVGIEGQTATTGSGNVTGPFWAY
jgi:Protein of unknown function (DUF3443)